MKIWRIPILLSKDRALNELFGWPRVPYRMDALVLFGEGSTHLLDKELKALVSVVIIQNVGAFSVIQVLEETIDALS